MMAAGSFEACGHSTQAPMLMSQQPDRAFAGRGPPWTRVCTCCPAGDLEHGTRPSDRGASNSGPAPWNRQQHVRWSTPCSSPDALGRKRTHASTTTASPDAASERNFEPCCPWGSAAVSFAAVHADGCIQQRPSTAAHGSTNGVILTSCLRTVRRASKQY